MITQTIQASRVTGFSLPETLIAMAIFGLAFASLFSALNSGVSTVRSTRETLRATQILDEKLDTVRLYTWDQVNSGYISNKFYVPFCPTNNLPRAVRPAGAGCMYTGIVSIVQAPITESYKTNLKEITIDLYWQSGGHVRHSRMKTFVARYGMQTYIY